MGLRTELDGLTLGRSRDISETVEKVVRTYIHYTTWYLVNSLKTCGALKKKKNYFSCSCRVQLVLARLPHASLAQLAQSRACMLALLHTCLVFFLVVGKPGEPSSQWHSRGAWAQTSYTGSGALPRLPYSVAPKWVTCLAQYQRTRVPQRCGGSEELTPSIQHTKMVGKFGSRAVRL